HASAWAAAVTTCTSSPMPATRSSVERSSVWPPDPSGSRCLGCATRLSGHSRVPLPPASTRTCRLKEGLARARREKGGGAGIAGEVGGEVGVLPGQVEIVASEMPERGHLAVDGPAQLERADDPERRQIDVL